MDVSHKAVNTLKQGAKTRTLDKCMVKKSKYVVVCFQGDLFMTAIMVIVTVAGRADLQSPAERRLDPCSGGSEVFLMTKACGVRACLS